MPSRIISLSPSAVSKTQLSMFTLSLEGLQRVTHSFPLSLPAGFWSKAYISTFEEADKVVDVAKGMPVKRSIKASPNIKACFLFILTEIFTWLFYSCLFIQGQ